MSFVFRFISGDDMCLFGISEGFVMGKFNGGMIQLKP